MAIDFTLAIITMGECVSKCFDNNLSVVVLCRNISYTYLPVPMIILISVCIRMYNYNESLPKNGQE